MSLIPELNYIILEIEAKMRKNEFMRIIPQKLNQYAVILKMYRGRLFVFTHFITIVARDNKPRKFLLVV